MHDAIDTIRLVKRTKEFWLWARRKTEGYLKIIRGMTTKPKGKRTSAFYQDKSGDGVSAYKTKNTRRVKKSKREYFTPFLLLSLIAHAVLILLIAFLFAKRAAEQNKPPLEPPPPEVTLEIPPPDKKDRPFVEAKKIADKAPDKALFQSDENTKAASEMPASGSIPLPSQQGVKQPAMELQTQHYTPGDRPATSAGNPAEQRSSFSPSSQAEPEQQQALSTPNSTLAPVATPEGDATPQPTPLTPPLPNSLKLLSLPKEASMPRLHPSVSQRKTTSPIRPSIIGSLGSKKGYQPETRQSVIYGSISNRGRSSVAAKATPLGRYKKMISTAIGSRWNYYVKECSPNIGTVTISFSITASGRVTGLRVVSDTGNTALTDCTLRSIMDAKIPPIPPNVAATLQDGKLEYRSFSFTIY